MRMIRAAYESQLKVAEAHAVSKNLLREIDR
jgi:hypothetical protein